MGDSKRIPYSRMEEIKKFNQKMEETSDEWEKEMYRRAKKVRVPYERLDMIFENSTEKIYALSKKRRRRKYVKILFLSGCFVLVILGIVMIISK